MSKTSADLTAEQREHMARIMAAMNRAEQRLVLTMDDYITLWLENDRASVVFKREQLHAMLDVHLDACDAAFTLMHQYGMLPLKK